MWANAAAHVAKFSEGVITAVDAQGYPISVRQLTLPFDAATGSMPVTLSDSLDAVEGPANLLCHFHDDKLWNMRAIQLKGRLERTGQAWMFVTTAFTPPSTVQMIKGLHRSAKNYLDKRSLPRPQVNFDAVNKMWERAKKIVNA